jgi:hypothetical protein
MQNVFIGLCIPTAWCLDASLAVPNPRVGTTSRILWRKAAIPALCSAPIPDRRVRYADVISLSIGRSWSIKRNTTGSGQRAKHDRVRVSGPRYRCVYGRAVARQTKACASRLSAFRIPVFLAGVLLAVVASDVATDGSPSATVDIPGLMKTEVAHEILTVRLRVWKLRRLEGCIRAGAFCRSSGVRKSAGLECIVGVDSIGSDLNY